MPRIFVGGDRSSDRRWGSWAGGQQPPPPPAGSGSGASAGIGSPGQRFGSGWVGSRVSVTDPVCVAFAHALLLLLGREYATLESPGFCVLYIFMSCCLY